MGVPREQARRFSIVLPLPEAALHQNARPGHWAKRSQPTKKARAAVALEARFIMCKQGIKPFRFNKARVTFLFGFPDRRPRDLLNYVAACKAYVDGCVDADVIVADDWQHLESGGATGVCVKDQPHKLKSYVLLDFEEIG